MEQNSSDTFCSPSISSKFVEWLGMPISMVQTGGRVLWCLRRRSSNVRCVVYDSTLPIEVRVLQDQDVVLSELFPEANLAIRWADVYGERLKQQGWVEAPTQAR